MGQLRAMTKRVAQFLRGVSVSCAAVPRRQSCLFLVATFLPALRAMSRCRHVQSAALASRVVTGPFSEFTASQWAALLSIRGAVDVSAVQALSANARGPQS